MEELKPCKCLSSIVEIQGNFFLERGGWCVVCPDCGYQTPIFLSKEAAIDAWNKRS